MSSSLFIIPIFIPHSGCPHRCVFCNQHLITGISQHTRLSIDEIISQIQRQLHYRTAKRTVAQISFYGGNFLGLEPDLITNLLAVGEKFVQAADVNSIRFSTRPDTITEDRLALIKPYTVSTVEIGVQSLNDRALTASHRGHTASEAEHAARLLQAQGYETGIQLMVGLPEDTAAELAQTVTRVIALGPDFVRIYPTLVLEHSPLAKRFKQGEYTPLPLDQCVSMVKNMYVQFSAHGIKVARMGLQATTDLDAGSAILAGPYHPAFGHLVQAEIFFDKAILLLQQKQFRPRQTLRLLVNPRSVSRMRGLNNHNIEKLQRLFGFKEISVIPTPNLSTDDLSIDC